MILQKLRSVIGQNKSKLAVILVFVFILTAPIVGILSANAILASMAMSTIPLNLKTWIAMMVLMGAFGWRSNIQIVVTQNK